VSGHDVGYSGDLTGVYDAVYTARNKDYAGEAAMVAGLVRRLCPVAGSLLDVACGTGTHLEHFKDIYGDVAGLELSADMLAAAGKRLPDVPLHRADMRDFALGRTFDVVTCMFSSIAYMADQDELDAAVAAMARHLTSRGVLVIEPWWFPETFLPGYVAGDVATAGDGRTVARVSHTVREGTASRMEAHYLVADAATGVRHFVVTHINTLFERSQYEAAFARSGLAADYVAGGPSGRGLFIAGRG
jgi:SAM-dependent methyltransferase